MLYRIIKLTCLHVLCVSHHFLCTFLRVCSDDVPFITSSSIIVYMLPLVIKEEHLKLERVGWESFRRNGLKARGGGLLHR